MKMFRSGIWLILGVVVLSLSVAPSHAAIIWEDNFNTENGGAGALNFTTFTKWDVTNGAVDLIGNGFWDIIPGNGLYVDLDGTGTDSGTMTSHGIPLAAGNYTLDFYLAGNNRGYANDTVIVTVSVAGLTNSYELASGIPFTHFSLAFSLASATPSANIVFDHAGADWQGILLDRVSISSVPEPSTLLLLGSGLLGLVGFGRRRFKK